MASLLGGSGSQTTNSMYGSNSISGPVPGSPYEVFQNDQLTQHIAPLANAPFQWYDTNNMFAGFNGAQNNAFQGFQNLQNNYETNFNQGASALSQNSGAGYDPVQAGQAAFAQASGTPTGLGTANPYLQQSGQSAASIVDQYMNPYVDKAVNAANRLSTQNFLQNALPGITDQFVSSGGGLGGKNYGRDMNWALTNFNTALNDSTQGALAAGYNSSLAAAQNDLARYGQLGATAGNLALGDLSGRTNLGTAMGNNAALGAQTNVNNANAWGNLGTAQTNAALGVNNALLAAGNQQQAQEQLPLTANYEQFKEAQQWPYQTAGWAANTANQYNWPQRQNTQGWQQSTQSGGQEGSILGSVLGGLSAVGSLAIPGAGGASAIGNLMGGIGKWFGPSGGGTAPHTGGYLRSMGEGRLGLSPHSADDKPRKMRTFADGGYLGLNAATPAYKAMRNGWGEPDLISRGFDNFDRPSVAPYTKSAFSNTYARGGDVSAPTKRDIVKAVHEHELVMHDAKRSQLTPIKFMSGGYLGLNASTDAPKAQPAFRNTYATGGTVPVIKVMRENTKRSNKAADTRRAALKKAMRNTGPLDLEPRSGYFS